MDLSFPWQSRFMKCRKRNMGTMLFVRQRTCGVAANSVLLLDTGWPGLASCQLPVSSLSLDNHDNLCGIYCCIRDHGCRCIDVELPFATTNNATSEYLLPLSLVRHILSWSSRVAVTHRWAYKIRRVFQKDVHCCCQRS